MIAEKSTFHKLFAEKIGSFINHSQKDVNFVNVMQKYPAILKKELRKISNFFQQIMKLMWISSKDFRNSMNSINHENYSKFCQSILEGKQAVQKTITKKAEMLP